jgi:hypothetical protein
MRNLEARQQTQFYPKVTDVPDYALVVGIPAP